MSDKFNEAFGLPEEEPKRQLELFQPPKENAEEDFIYARSNLYNTIEHAQLALDDLAKFAKSAQSARVYEVLANMIKTSIDASKGLLDLQKQRLELRKAGAPQAAEGERPTINNNLFLTTAEFQRLVKEHKNKQNDD